MNKFVTGALALAVAGSASYAEPPNSDWLELDSEINTLAKSMPATGDFTNIKVLLRGGYVYGSDGLSVTPVAVAGGGEDAFKDYYKAGDGSVSGVRFWDAEINGSAQIGDVQVRLGFDFAPGLSIAGYDSFADEWYVVEIGGIAVLQDAYAAWDCGDFEVVCGQYKPHITRSNFVDPENQFFLERSVIGSSYDFWDAGIGASGSYGAFGWNVDIMNGNGIESGHMYFLRALWNFGRDAGGYETTPEDAVGAGDEFAGTVGVWYEAQDVVNQDWWTGQGKSLDTDNYGIDFQGTYGQFGFGLEYMMRGDQSHGRPHPMWMALDLSSYYMQTLWDTSWTAPMSFVGDSNPFSVYGTYLANDQWGFGIRYEDLDNGGDAWDSLAGEIPGKGDDNTVITLGVNRYDVGHNGKLGANIAMIGSDFDDSTVFQVGYTYGASR